ncbi:MAG: Hsp33 family molecular chaperone HslO [Clostridium sp.]|nr:Hsp33 family molecular chaperone HslO [Clostridium sp.]MCM1546843.1 Hsp33 family molecular chaperone HslO [Ruminococcus sp.]
MGILKRAISKDASVVSMALDATDIVSEIEKIHQTSAVVTAALGRLTIAASMMGYGLKGKDDSLTIKLDGGGPAGMLIAVSDGMGNVKSYVRNPVVEIPLNSVGKLDVAGAVGTDGTLTVSKDLGLKEPYSGTIPIVSGEIGEDIANYFVSSEQVPTVCGLGVLVNPDLTVNSAGGFLVQLLPFASDKCIETIEKNISGIKSVSDLFIQHSPDEVALMLLDGLEPDILDGNEPVYRCDCSRERTERILSGLGNEELESMASEMSSIDVECHFCGEKYEFTPDEVRALKKTEKN